MTDATSSILGHYGAEDLINRIMRALAAAGYSTASPTVEMLNLIDQLHGGGLNLTKAQAEMAGRQCGSFFKRWKNFPPTPGPPKQKKEINRKKVRLLAKQRKRARGTDP